MKKKLDVDVCPESQVSTAVGWVGVFGVCLVVAAIKDAELAPELDLLLLFLGAVVPMLAWSLLVDKVHLRPSTGINYNLIRSWEEVKPIVMVKLVGLFATILGVFGFYTLFRFYHENAYLFFIDIFRSAMLLVFILALPYIYFTTRHMTEPKDGLWHFGSFVLLRKAEVDYDLLQDYVRAWVIKTFFLAFMGSIVYGNWTLFANALDFSQLFQSPQRFVLMVVGAFMFFDVIFGTIGYVFMFRIFDTHVRSSNPYVLGWFAALICYPPFSIMGRDDPLYYKLGAQEWFVWFAGFDSLMIVWAVLLVLLMFIYAWATIVFGLRFSNLTNRGIITNGPYQYFKHPAYLSKNIFWWMSVLPFFSTISWTEGLRNCFLLGLVSAIYYLRAKTEERHLLEDSVYQEYSAWIAHHGLFPRVWRSIKRMLS